MKNFKYIMLIFLSAMPYSAMAMDKQGAVALLSESKKEYGVKAKARQGEYVTGRSADRKQPLLAAPVYGANKPIHSGRELSETPGVTVRKKTLTIRDTAKTLCDLAIESSHPEKRKYNLNHSTCIAQKIGFDSSVRRGNVKQAIAFLDSNNGLKTSYPLAIKLYAIMKSEADELIIYPGEAAIIPVGDICRMAKSLAVFGHNEVFLENYARIMHEDPEIRKIIQDKR